VALKALQAERDLFGLNRPDVPSQEEGTTTIEAMRLKTLTVRQWAGMRDID
jgi:hypothetical protein